MTYDDRHGGEPGVHTYAADGTYTVTLTVTDAWGDAATATRVVTITKPATNVAPVPVIGVPVCGGRVCTFSGAGSSDANGDAFTYSWNWGDATAVGTGVEPGGAHVRGRGHLHGDAHGHRRVGRCGDRDAGRHGDVTLKLQER